MRSSTDLAHGITSILVLVQKMLRHIKLEVVRRDTGTRNAGQVTRVADLREASFETFEPGKKQRHSLAQLIAKLHLRLLRFADQGFQAAQAGLKGFTLRTAAPTAQGL